jgi:hypothetical protein
MSFSSHSSPFKLYLAYTQATAGSPLDRPIPYIRRALTLSFSSTFPCTVLQSSTHSVHKILLVITFASDHHFGMADKGLRGAERNNKVGREWEVVSAVIHNFHGTSFCRLSTVINIFTSVSRLDYPLHVSCGPNCRMCIMYIWKSGIVHNYTTRHHRRYFSSTYHSLNNLEKIKIGVYNFYREFNWLIGNRVREISSVSLLVQLCSVIVPLWRNRFFFFN